MFVDKVILVVKDAQTEHETIKAYLEHEFSDSVILAVSGLKALTHVLVEQPPHLAVIVAPVAWAELDEIMARMKADSLCPIIFVPNEHCVEPALKAMRLGIDDCIIRPNSKTTEYSSRTILKLLECAVYRALQPSEPALTEDVEQEKKAREIHANQLYLIGKLTSTVAHDFNNLLTIIHGYSHLAVQELLDDGNVPKVIQYMEKIEAKTALGGSLINKIMQFSHKPRSESVVLNLNAVVADTKEMLRGVLGEGIEFVVELPDADVPIRIDPKALELVLINLVDNACHAMHGQGKLTIHVEQREIDTEQAAALNIAPNIYASLRITDTGEGMDEMTTANIFDAFFTTKKLGVGTGLGLASVHSCVKQHGGEIFVRSQPARGTTFEILWPRDDTHRGQILGEMSP